MSPSRRPTTTRRILLTGLPLAATGAAAAGDHDSPIRYKNYSGCLFNVRVLIHSVRRTDAFDFFALDANQVKVCRFPVASHRGDVVSLDVAADYFDDMGRRCEMSRAGIPYRLYRVDAGAFLTVDAMRPPPAARSRHTASTSTRI